MSPIELTVYAVRNQDGKWYNAKRFEWADDVNDAKLYTRIGYARGRVTNLARNLVRHPGYSVPEIVEFKLVEHQVISEVERVREARDKREVELKRQRLEAAERELVVAQKQVSRYRKLLDALK